MFELWNHVGDDTNDGEERGGVSDLLHTWTYFGEILPEDMVTIIKHGYRLDKLIAWSFGISVTEASRMIKQGAVEINGKKVPADARTITWPELWEIQ